MDFYKPLIPLRNGANIIININNNNENKNGAVEVNSLSHTMSGHGQHGNQFHIISISCELVRLAIEPHHQ